MKAHLRTFSLSIIAILVLTLSITATSRGENVILDEQIVAIKARCSALQATLNQLQRNDTLQRHDNGQTYRMIMDKLMTPLNQRIASNKLDGGELVATSAAYSRAYQEFYDAYISYDQSLSDARGIDCTKQPTRFYDQIADAHTKRTKVYETSSSLTMLSKQYKEQFDAFRKNLEGGAK